MTVKELRDALGLLGAGYDTVEIKVWLPGSTISLSNQKGQNVILPGKPGVVLIEGNLDPDSLLAMGG